MLNTEINAEPIGIVPAITNEAQKCLGKGGLTLWSKVSFAGYPFRAKILALTSQICEVLKYRAYKGHVVLGEQAEQYGRGCWMDRASKISQKL